MVEPQAEIYLGSTLGWVPLATDADGPADHVRQAVASSGGGITITRGRTAEGTVAAPATATLVIDNDGRYSSRNPRSPYYGLIGRGTPLRIGLTVASDGFARTVASGWGTADSGQEWHVGTAASDYAVSGGVATIIHDTAHTTRGVWLDADQVDIEQVTDISVPTVVTGAAVVTGHIARHNPDTGDCYWLRLEFNPGGTLTAKISKWISGSLIELAALPDIPGLTYDADQPYRLRTSVVDGRLSLRIWPAGEPEPATWTLTATDTDITGPGGIGVLTWVVLGNEDTPLSISISRYRAVDRRAVLEVPEWPPRWSIGGDDRWVPIQAVGPLDRLSRARRPLQSALRRHVPTTSPVAYWPLEDPPGSVAALPDASTPAAEPMRRFGYSRFTIPGTGGQPQPAAGLPAFGSGEGIPGSAPVIDLSEGGTLWAPVPQVEGAEGGEVGWRVEWVMLCGRDRDDDQVVIQWVTDDAFVDHLDAERRIRWQVQVGGSGVFLGYGLDRSPLTTFGSGFAAFAVFDGVAHHYRVDAETIAETIVVRMYIDGVLAATVESFEDTMAGAAGQIQHVIINPLEVPSGTPSMPVIGHVAVWAPVPAAETYTWWAADGWRGETAAARLARLGAEQGIPIAVVGDPDQSSPMGPQGVKTWYDLVVECATTDGGILYEQRETLGLAYRTRTSLYNQDPLVEVDYSAGHLAPPLEPAGPQDPANDITVVGSTGTARAVVEGGPMSIQDPPDGIGSGYDRSITVNEAYPRQLPGIAQWIRHILSWEEERYPALTVRLHADPWASDPEMLARAVALDAGRVLVLGGLPDWVPPGPIRLMVQGYTEVIPTSAERTITWVMEPAGPYTVGVLGVTTRVSVRSQTAAPFAAGQDTELLVERPAGYPHLWTADPAHYPMDLMVSGVRLRATGASGSGDPQVLTVDPDPVNGVVKTIPAGATVALAEPWRLAR